MLFSTVGTACVPIQSFSHHSSPPPPIKLNHQIQNNWKRKHRYMQLSTAFPVSRSNILKIQIYVKYQKATNDKVLTISVWVHNVKRINPGLWIKGRKTFAFGLNGVCFTNRQLPQLSLNKILEGKQMLELLDQASFKSCLW